MNKKSDCKKTLFPTNNVFYNHFLNRIFYTLYVYIIVIVLYFKVNNLTKLIALAYGENIEVVPLYIQCFACLFS